MEDKEIQAALTETRKTLKILSVRDLRRNRKLFISSSEITDDVKKLFLPLYDELEREKTRWGDAA